MSVIFIKEEVTLGIGLNASVVFQKFTNISTNFANNDNLDAFLD